MFSWLPPLASPEWHAELQLFEHIARSTKGLRETYKTEKACVHWNSPWIISIPNLLFLFITITTSLGRSSGMFAFTSGCMQCAAWGLGRLVGDGLDSRQTERSLWVLHCPNINADANAYSASAWECSSQDSEPFHFRVTTVSGHLLKLSWRISSTTNLMVMTKEIKQQNQTQEIWKRRKLAGLGEGQSTKVRGEKVKMTQIFIWSIRKWLGTNLFCSRLISNLHNHLGSSTT